MKPYLVIMILSVAIVLGVTLHVQAAGTWKDRDAVIQWVSSHPVEVADWLAERFSQAQLDQLEAYMFPPPTVDQQREMLRLLIRDARKLDLATNDPLYIALMDKWNALPPEQ